MSFSSTDSALFGTLKFCPKPRPSPFFFILLLCFNLHSFYASPLSTSPLSFLSSIPSSLDSYRHVAAHRLFNSYSYSTLPLSSLSHGYTSRLGTPEGYSLDPCREDTDCIYPRHCVTKYLDSLCWGQAGCLCAQREMEICNRTCDECVNYPNETCVYLVGDSKNGQDAPDGVCASKYTISEGSAVEWGCDSYPDITPIPEAYFESGGSDYGKSENGTDDRTETGNGNGNGNGTNGNSSNTYVGSDGNGNDDENEIDKDEGNECIHIEALKHLPKNSLVYPTDRRAAVLCDASGNCATPAHIVVHNGNGMTMQTYCITVPKVVCSRSVRLVNSPRMQPGTRIKSRTAGLTYSVLAASYGTQLEEMVMQLLIRLGL